MENNVTPQDLPLSFLQTDLVWEAPTENLQRFEQRIRDVAGSKLIVLPEMFTTGLTMNPSSVAQTMDGEAVTWMRRTATVLSGAFPSMGGRGQRAPTAPPKYRHQG